MSECLCASCVLLSGYLLLSRMATLIGQQEAALFESPCLATLLDLLLSVA